MAWGSPSVEVASLSAREVYTALLEADEIRNVVITEPIDLTNAAVRPRVEGAERRTIVFDRVDFEHGLEAAGGEVAANLIFRDVRFQSIIAKNVKWQGRVTFEGGEIRGWALFDHNTFDTTLQFNAVTFHGGASFRGARLSGDADFLQCLFAGDSTAGFSRAHFLGPSHFNDSEFQGLVKFDSAVFHGDASFVRMHARKRASFQNVMFQRDAEFRFAHIEDARFGDQSRLTVFHGFADFRGAEMGHAVFDFVDFRHTVSFVNARFGPGGASFGHANFGGPLANFDGMASKGPVVLRGAYMPTLRFHWDEIGKPVLATGEGPNTRGHDARIPVLEQLLRRLEDLGRSAESQKVYYHLSELRTWEALARSDIPLTDKVLVLGEWALWGFPTGYGTKLGRMLAVSLASWLIFALPFLLRRGALIRVGLSAPNGGQGLTEGLPHWSYEPVYGDELPAGAYSPMTFLERLRVAWLFSFALLFKTPLRGIRYFEFDRQTPSYGFHYYLFAVWVIGAIYMALLGLTLANTSPALNKLIGKVIF